MNEHRLEVADVFRQYETEFFARWGDRLSPQQRKVFRDICTCQTDACGGRLEQCDRCGHQELWFNSCRNRHCPKCQSRARDQWLARTAKELLPVRYCHVVFTLPGQLAPVALQNPRVIYDMLFRAASEALLTIAADPHRLGVKIGFLAVLHTWNQQVRVHPHLHCLIPAGGLAPDNSRWIDCRRKYFLPVKVLGKRFRRQFLRLLSKAYRASKLRFSGSTACLNHDVDFDRFFFQLKKLNWVIYAKRPFGGPEHMLKYLARYTHRVAISNGRLVSLRDRQLTFRWRDSADQNKQKLLTIDAIEFIHRFLQHVLPAGFVKIRHFGFLANPKRREALQLCRALLHARQPLAPITQIPDAPLIRTCPQCGIGTLCLIAWLPPDSPLLSSADLALPAPAPADSS